MKRAKINELYDKSYVVHEIPYESSVVDPTIVSIHKQKVWDRYLFAKLIIEECSKVNDECIGRRIGEIDLDMLYKEHFGIK